MPIAPKPLIESEAVNIRFPKTLLQEVDAYCKYLGGASDRSYVIVEAVREVVERDKGFRRSLGKPGKATDTAEKLGAETASAKGRKPAAPVAAPLREGAA